MSKVFADTIKDLIIEDFGKSKLEYIENKPVIQYLIKKTKSANQGSKTRGSFANIYAIYVLVEDYISKGFHSNNEYSKYKGARFTDLFVRQRELPFGNKLQNHAYQGRLNEDFKKYFPLEDKPLLIRDTETQSYWINENLIKYEENNLSELVIKIIDSYVEAKQDSMASFIGKCNELKEISKTNTDKVFDFIMSLLDYNVDARLFEIVSYSILKHHYKDIAVYFGFDRENIIEENLKLYKTGRTNANDGGIDFVMKPLGRFFQVTETTDFKKYFLDIDKIEKFPITFVVKTTTTIEDMKKEIEEKAYEIFSIKSVVDKYLDSVEELINITVLETMLNECKDKGYVISVLDEIILQSKVEFHFNH
jgi:hypothetical protein